MTVRERAREEYRITQILRETNKVKRMRRLRETIAEDVAEFLANGGRIQILPGPEDKWGQFK